MTLAVAEALNPNKPHWTGTHNGIHFELNPLPELGTITGDLLRLLLLLLWNFNITITITLFRIYYNYYYYYWSIYYNYYYYYIFASRFVQTNFKRLT